MALRGNNYFPVVPAVWEFPRQRCTELRPVKSGILSKNSRVIKRPEDVERRFLVVAILIAIPRGTALSRGHMLQTLFTY